MHQGYLVKIIFITSFTNLVIPLVTVRRPVLISIKRFIFLWSPKIDKKSIEIIHLFATLIIAFPRGEISFGQGT